RAPRALRLLCSREAPHAAVSPLGRDEADEREEERGHVPQLALLDDGDAAPAVADRLGQRRRVRRREEAAAGVLRNALQQRRAHRGVEVLRVAPRTGASNSPAPPADTRTCRSALPSAF